MRASPDHLTPRIRHKKILASRIRNLNFPIPIQIHRIDIIRMLYCSIFHWNRPQQSPVVIHQIIPDQHLIAPIAIHIDQHRRMPRSVIMRRHPQLRQIAIQNISRIPVFIRRISTIIDFHHKLLPRRIALKIPGLHLRKIICRQLLLRLHLTRFSVKNRQHIPHNRNHLGLPIAIHVSSDKIIASM